MYGAMDHIDKKRDKRPKGSRPEGWDASYAKQVYERGVPAGKTEILLDACPERHPARKCFCVCVRTCSRAVRCLEQDTH